MNVMYVWEIVYTIGGKVKWVTLNGLNPHTVIGTLQRIQYDKSKKLVIYVVRSIGHIDKSNSEVVLLPLLNPVYK
ncbi:hypothetical protein BCP01_101 [Bacillus phage BCP01]|nr:hypothetical protein BCP01_101 [Bacillus phage BCP01]